MSAPEPTPTREAMRKRYEAAKGLVSMLSPLSSAVIEVVLYDITKLLTTLDAARSPRDEASEREAFEKWASNFDRLPFDKAPTNFSSSGYADAHTHFAWLAWTARSRRDAPPATREIPAGVEEAATALAGAWYSKYVVTKEGDHANFQSCDEVIEVRLDELRAAIRAAIAPGEAVAWAVVYRHNTEDECYALELNRESADAALDRWKHRDVNNAAHYFLVPLYAASRPPPLDGEAVALLKDCRDALRKWPHSGEDPVLARLSSKIAAMEGGR